MWLDKHDRRPFLGTGRAVASLLGIAVVFSTSSARAGSEEFCRQYTADAIADQQRNLDMKCGFTGPPWSSNPAGHHPWCIGAREDSANQQRNDRRSWLARCERCNGYADRAMAAVEKAAKLCNFTDARWSTDRPGHFRWCMEAKDEFVNREDNYRTYDADKCVRCTNYAAEATRSQEENLSRGCGFTGPDWTLDRNGHFSWCWNLARSYQGEPGAHSATRQRMLANCPDAAKRQRCESYAERAVSQYHAMRSLSGCNQSGPKWSDNRADHYNWCTAVPPAEAAAQDRERDAKLAECGRRPAPPAGEQCLFSAVVSNKKCLNVDGTPMSRREGELTATGCGATQDSALARAKTSFAANQCLTPGDTPAPGCCTFSATVSPGCLCGTGVRSLPAQPIRATDSIRRLPPP